MAYKNIKKLLEKADPWEYNFEFESGDTKFTSLKTLDRYFIFRALPNGDYGVYNKANQFINSLLIYSNIYDPDGSGYVYYPLTHEIYSVLWNWQKGEDTTFGEIKSSGFEKISENKLCMFGGDTMNSVQYFLDSLYALIEKEVNSKLKLTKRGQISLKYMLQCMQDEPRFCEVLLSEAKKKDIIIEEYINLYHTLGNFVLVPKWFNGDRGTKLYLFKDKETSGYSRSKEGGKYYKKIDDFWDLSLEYLKENGFHKKIKESEVNFDKEMFNWYINFFFLWDYVRKDDNKYTVKEISPRDKNDITQYKDFFTNSVRFIKRRGKFMTAMIKIQFEKAELYKKIQEHLTSGDFWADSIFDAAKQIFEQFNGKIPESAEMLLSELKDGKV